MNSFLRQVVLLLLRWLEEHLDTDLKTRLTTYRNNRQQLEAQTKQEQEKISEVETNLAQLQTQRSGLEQTLAASEAAIQTLKEEVEKIDEEPGTIDDVGDGDLLRVDLRRSH